MHRKVTLPEVFTNWLDEQDKKIVEQLLSDKIVRKMENIGLDINNLTELENHILENDKKYFSLQESGNTKEYMHFFCRARLLSAAKFIKQGNFNDALYEYFYSFDTDDPNEVIKDLDKN